MALQKRYGNLDDAPSTILSAGAPYVLYVSQTSTPHHPSSVENHALDNFDSIQSEMKGIAVIEYVGVPAEEITRAAIVSKLKDAVFKRALSPTLMIVDVQLHATLSAASGLLRAVCDSYGMHMHVEGNALSMSLTGTNAKNLFYNVSDLVDAAHTTSFDIANWFGNYNTAVVLHCPEPFDDDLLRVPNAPADLTACMSLSYLLQRMRLHTSADVLLKACEHAGTLVETADRLPSIFECRTVGCGEIVLLSCPASCLAWSSNKSINRALMAYFRRHHTEMEQFLELTTFDGREWLTFSPSHTLRHFSLSQLSSVSVLRICEDLINACRVHDLVSKGRAAFMSEIRQCHDVEVDLLESQHETVDTKALFYAALRVTPFGEVARNGHWKGDEEMVAAVAKYTRSLADVLADQAGKNFEALFHPVKQFPEVIFIGPAVPQSRIDEKVTVEYGIDDLSHKNPTIDMILAGAEAKELEEAGAPDIATTVADCVISAVHIALSPHHRATLDKAISHKVQNDTHDANGVESPDEAVLEASPIIPRLDQHDQSHPLTNRKQDEDSSPTSHVHASQTKPREEVNLVDKSEVGDLALNTDMNTAGESKPIPITSDPHVPESETTHQPKPRPGFWRTLFGNDSPEDTENDSSTESLQPLEDDYFRP